MNKGMITLSHRPNVLYLTAIRHHDVYLKLLITQLRRDIYWHKLRALAETIDVLTDTCMDVYDADGKEFHIHGIFTIHRFFDMLHNYGDPAIYDEHRRNEYWFHNDVLHCDGGAAVTRMIMEEREDGTLEQVDIESYWYTDGKLHSQNVGGYLFPAVHYMEEGVHKWYKDGKKHRDDGPALIKNCRYEWWINGNPHREQAPAIIDHGDMVWLKHGLIHRKDGPAIVRANGDMEWWIRGKRHRIGGPAVITKNKKCWMFSGILHRLNGPAKIKVMGDTIIERWFRHGMLHRKDGPALIVTKACREVRAEWYKHGFNHRKHGPASIDYTDGTVKYYCHGELHREDGPAIRRSGDFMWYLYGELHRIGGPALKWNGAEEWWENGQIVGSD